MRLGVLDVGSNTVHLLVVDAYPGGRPAPAFSHKTELRLADHLDNGSALSKPGERSLRDVVVEGRTIVRAGKPTGIDLPAIEAELRGLYRDGVKQFGRLEQAWAPLSASLGRWFEAQWTCG